MRVRKALLVILFAATGCGSLTSCAVNNTVSNSNLARLQSMVAQGVDVNAQRIYGYSELDDAAYRGEVPVARFLLDNGAPINPQRDDGVIPLETAIWRGHTQLVRFLIGRGANVNHVNPVYGTTPLMICGEYGNAEMARLLIAAGASLTAKDKDNRTAVYYATDNKKLDVLGVFRKAGATVPYTGKADRDVVIAAIAGDKGKVLELIAAGIDPNSEIEEDRHLLTSAVDANWPDVVAQLLGKGADANDLDRDGWTAMMHAAMENQTETLKAFAMAGVKMSYTGEVKDDLLVAVLMGDRDKIATLVAQKADVNSRYRYNSPLLNYAVYKKDLAMANLLLDNKADPNLANDSGISPFFISLMKNDRPMVKLMLDRGANVNATNPSGFSALMYAIAYTDTTTVKELLDRGAQPDAAAVILSRGGNTYHPKVNLPEITALIRPEVLRRQMLRAQAAVETAQTPADYQNAIQEYEIARRVAPDTAEIYYNLGLVQDKAGAYGDAIQNLREYLRLAAAAGDAQAVKDMIYKLEYKRDQAARTR
ncbi:ankyrin repeat domain-containing protein [Geobacter sp. AOG1]|uniref:ankyrin repeat domain-containing protein n=1 Tax=Geobacter sp. AOG1 TaxID=1566346 RepID=UPI001CC7EE92|nr:ankyrin repeat domain-containing protein [Geobacter sp. AOG1]GFE56221.1 hypothetical protein AOG1_00990 [Geobacter sp. AOG1]